MCPGQIVAPGQIGQFQGRSKNKTAPPKFVYFPGFFTLFLLWGRKGTSFYKVLYRDTKNGKCRG
jgi:hypothetical protein